MQKFSLTKIGYYFVLIMFVLLPFHAFLTTSLSSLLTTTTNDQISSFSFVIASWKEILMSIMLIIIVIDSILKKKLPFKPLLIDYLLILLLVWAFVSAFTQSDSLLQGVLGIRFDFEFFILYWIVRSIKLSKDQFSKIIKYGLGAISFSLLLGFIQINMSCETLSFFGYTPYVSSWVASKPLPCGHGVGGDSETLRMMGTFSGPNQMASYLIIMIMLGWNLLSQHIEKAKNCIYTKYAYIIFLAVAVTGLYFTYSRSAMLALLTAFLCLLVLQATDSKKTFGYILLGMIISVLLFVGNIVLSPNRSASTQEHFAKPLEGIVLITEKPWGYGIGMAGPVSLRFPPDGSNGIISESWYLQIAQEFGMLGGVLFFLLLSFVVRYLYQKQSNVKNLENKNLILTVLAIYTGLLVNNLFLHTWSSDMMTSLIFWTLFAYCIEIETPKTKKAILS